jgi:hypothetical protein
MQRHRHNHVKLLFTGQRAIQEPAQRRCQRLHTAVLEYVDELSERPFVFSVGVNSVESTQTASA